MFHDGASGEHHECRCGVGVDGRAGVSAAGFDSPSPDTAPFATHKKLLGHGILIIENLVNLERLLGVGEFEVVALPVKFAADGGLARVVARVPA